MESLTLKVIPFQVSLLACYYNVFGQLQCTCLGDPGGNANCATCDDGCFLIDKSCVKCPDNCTTCSHTLYCGQCRTGFYGTTCENLCATCENGQCSKTSCISGCADGFFLTEVGLMCEKCRSECYTCNSYFECTTCKPGYYGQYCQYSCSTCKYNTCYKNNGNCINGCQDEYYPSTGVCCPSTCISCESYSNCTVCTTGYFGSKCQFECSNCKGITCNKDNGQCTYGCAGGYHQPQLTGGCVGCPTRCGRCNSETDCTLCNIGYYGPPSCRLICDSNCKFGFCNSDTGKCTNGCVDGYYQNGYSCLPNCPIDFCQTCISDNQSCSVCQDGYHIFNGQCSPCRRVCLNGKCDKTDGGCSEGCKYGFTGHFCNDRCYSDCIACEQYNKETCTLCKPGYYGRKCELECNLQCKEIDGNRSCVKTNGECTHGCENGYTGSTCIDRCRLNCMSCDHTDQRLCDTCNTGYYGQVCDEECSSHCGMLNDKRHCYKDTGECFVNCTKGYRGIRCDVPCEVGCHDRCDRDTGTCDRCKTLYYGPSCEYTCNSTCYNPDNGSSVCNKETGDCLLSCTPAMCESIEQDQTVKNASPVTTHVIIAATTGFVACFVLCFTGIVIFVVLRRKRRNTSNAEQTNVALENNPDAMYSVLDHANQDRPTDYTALHTLRGQPQEGQVTPFPPTDGNNATYVNADDTITEPAKDGYENVFI